MSDQPTISAVVEGTVDEAMVRRLLPEIGATPGPIYGRNGKAAIRRHIEGYNRAARFSPWIVLVDLNGDEDCAPLLRADWLPSPAPNLCFRVAVRETEAWLLADRDRFAHFLGVSRDLIPAHPESVTDPKRKVVDLARYSRKREIREDLVPRVGSGRVVGQAYASRLIEFIQQSWRPGVAVRRSASLSRSLECLRRLVERIDLEKT